LLYENLHRTPPGISNETQYEFAVTFPLDQAIGGLMVFNTPPWPFASRSMAATGVWRTRGCWGRWSEWKVRILRQTMLKAPADEIGIPRYP
jgi:hypothetical protein